MSTEVLPGVIAVVLVSLATLVIGTWGLRISRTTTGLPPIRTLLEIIPDSTIDASQVLRSPLRAAG